MTSSSPVARTFGLGTTSRLSFWISGQRLASPSLALAMPDRVSPRLTLWSCGLGWTGVGPGRLRTWPTVSRSRWRILARLRTNSSGQRLASPSLALAMLDSVSPFLTL